MAKDVGAMLIAGLKKKGDDEGEDIPSDDGPEFDPGRESKVKAARAVRLAIQEKDDAELCVALDAYFGE